MKNGRRKGHQNERDTARYLTDHGPWGKVVTGRSKGAHTGDDLVLSTGSGRNDWALLPVSIEAKFVDRFEPVKWLEQAREQALQTLEDGTSIRRPYVVVSRQKYKPIGRSWVIERTSRGRWVMGWLDDWLEEQRELHEEVPF